MHSTSTLYDTIKSGLYTDRVILEIETVTNGTTEYVELDESKIYSLKTSGSVFPERQPSIGNFCARELDAVFIPPANRTIPKRARIRIFTYLDNGTQQSERIPKGVYWIDTREYTFGKTKMMVHGYDAAVKFDADIAETDFEWPVSPTTLILNLAQSVGVSVSGKSREALDAMVSIIYRVPFTICTKREMIKYLAAAVGYNAYIDDLGRLSFIPLRIDTAVKTVVYLADENGNPITIGGDRIIVDEHY